MNSEIQAKIEEEKQNMIKDEEERLKALLPPPTPPPESSSESSIDEDFMERRKQHFNIRDNLEKRKPKNSIVDNTHHQKRVSLNKFYHFLQTKVLENKKKLDAKKHSSLSPRNKSGGEKPKIKFYKGNKSKNLPPLRGNLEISSMSGFSSEFYKVRSSFSKIPIRDMGQAIEEKVVKPKTKKEEEVPKRDPRKELVKRLKLLDSVGKSNPLSSIGSIRKGFITTVKVREIRKFYKILIYKFELSSFICSNYF